MGAAKRSGDDSLGRLAAAIFLCVPAFGFGQRYLVTRIGIPAGKRAAVAVEVNLKGEVACFADDSGFYWSPTAGVVMLPGQGQYGVQQQVQGMSDSGTVVLSDVIPTGSFSAATWSLKDGLVNVMPPGAYYSDGHDINAAGEVVGRGIFENVQLAFVYVPGLGFLCPPLLSGYDQSEAWSINDRRQVGIVYNILQGPDYQAYWSEAEGIVNIGVPPGQLAAYALAVNYYAQFAGFVITPQFLYNGWLWSAARGHTVFQTEDFLGEIRGRGINSQGHISGSATVSRNPSRIQGYFWREGWPKAKNLNNLLDPSVRGVEATAAVRINDKGWIAGHAKFDGGPFEAVIYKPVTQAVKVGNVTVQTGRLLGGTVADLEEADGRAVRVSRFIVPNAAAPAVSLTLDAIAPTPMLYGWIKVRSRVVGAAGCTQQVQLFDWKRGLWESRRGTSQEMDGWTAQECVARGPGEWFVSPDGTLRAGVLVYGPPRPLWTLELDYAQWEFTPDDAP